MKKKQNKLFNIYYYLSYYALSYAIFVWCFEIKKMDYDIINIFSSNFSLAKWVISFLFIISIVSVVLTKNLLDTMSYPDNKTKIHSVYLTHKTWSNYFYPLTLTYILTFLPVTGFYFGFNLTFTLIVLAIQIIGYMYLTNKYGLAFPSFLLLSYAVYPVRDTSADMSIEYVITNSRLAEWLKERKEPLEVIPLKADSTISRSKYLDISALYK